MPIRSIVVVASIVGFGYAILRLLLAKKRESLFSGMRNSEKFLISMIIGTGALVIPSTLIGIVEGGKIVLISIDDFVVSIDMNTVALLYMSISSFLLAIALYGWVGEQIQALEDIRLPKIHSFAITALFILICVILVEILILEVILPLRGFDSLQYYFPRMILFREAQSIPKVDPLSFRLVDKAPMNMLLFTYALFVTNSLALSLIPVIYILTMVLVAYNVGMELFENQRKAIFASLAFLMTPLTYWLVDLWAYYQDIYVACFYALALYFYFKSNRSRKGGAFFAGMAGLSMALALLSKINAWTIPFVFVFVTPSGKRGKVWKLFLLTIFTLILMYNGATRTFIGSGIVIGLFGCLVGLLIAIDKERVASPLRNLFIALGVGFVGGGFWLIRTINAYPGALDELINQYLHSGKVISWVFPKQGDSLAHLTIERAHSVSFISTGLLLFVGSAFALTWLGPKILAMYRKDRQNFPIIWLFSFFMVWLAFYYQGSIRYLSPILIPIAIVSTDGIYYLQERVAPRISSSFLFEMTALFFAGLNFYYLIPLKYLQYKEQINDIGIVYLRSAIDYYSNPLILIILGIFACLTLVGILKLEEIYVSTGWRSIRFGKQVRQGVQIVLFSAIILLPIFVQGFVLFNENWDIESFQETYVYENRHSFKELVRAIILENDPNKTILVINTPGVQFHTIQPTIDLAYQSGFFSEAFGSNNATKVMELLENPLGDTQTNVGMPISPPSVGFIVTLRPQHLWYHYYLDLQYQKTYFFKMLDNNHYFTKVYSNEEFNLYKVKKIQPFIGVIDLSLENQESEASILGEIEQRYIFDSAPETFATLDLSVVKGENYTVQSNLFLNHLQQGQINISRTYSLVQGMNTISLGILNQTGEFEISSVSLDITWKFGGSLQSVSYMLTTPSSLLVRHSNQQWELLNGTGLTIS